jgi:transcriptional regulator with XRE-family HTH domain
LHPPVRHRRFSSTRIRELRLRAGLTVEQLADDIGKSVWTVIGYEIEGRVTPPTDVLPVIADRFGVAIDDLFTTMNADGS